MTKNVNIVSLVVALLGAAKLVLNAFGLDIITDQNINDIANGIAAIVTIAGVVMSHRKTSDNSENVVK